MGKGKVRYLGGSNYDTWRFAEAHQLAKEKNLTPFTVIVNDGDENALKEKVLTEAKSF